jgi:hypothetical protein
MKKNKEKKSNVTEVDRIGKILECLLFLNTTSQMGRKIANKSTRKAQGVTYGIYTGYLRVKSQEIFTSRVQMSSSWLTSVRSPAVLIQ